MGTQVIGLDVGTHAVRAVELSLGRGRPTVRRMAQVTLPPGVVVGGEVVEPTTVSAALRRLWREGGFKDRSVVVGVANSRVVARMADLPTVPDSELRSSLRYQVQDLIPIPLDEAVLDFQVIERDVQVGDELKVRLLLVAAHREMLRNLLTALAGAGLTAKRVDLIPLALIRAVHDPTGWMTDDVAPEGYDVIIGSGAGVTNVVVHHHGVPTFVRSLPTGGLAVTEAIATDLGIESEDAEAVKRGVGESTFISEHPHVDQIAAASLAPLADEVAGSIDFHRAQATDAGLRSVVLSGGGGRLTALRRLLEDQLGVSLATADPFAGMDVDRVPFDAATIARVADQFTVAIGLALPGDSTHPGRGIDLLPRESESRRTDRRRTMLAGAGVGVVAVTLVGATVMRGLQVDDARSEATRSEATVKSLTTQVASLASVEQLQTDITNRTKTVSDVLQGDIAWRTLFQDLTAALPDDVWLTSFNGTRTAAGSLGTVQIAAIGSDQTSGAHWLQRTEALTSFAAPWLVSSTRTDSGAGQPTVNFNATAVLADGARSDRLTQYVGGGK